MFEGDGSRRCIARAVYQQDAIRFLQEKLDFEDAYFHLVEARHKELEALGIADNGSATP